MTPELFSEIGTLLYGAEWTSAMANALEVADRNVRRWANGAHEIPIGVAIDIRHLIAERVNDLNRLASQLPSG